MNISDLKREGQSVVVDREMFSVCLLVSSVASRKNAKSEFSSGSWLACCYLLVGAEVLYLH